MVKAVSYSGRSGAGSRMIASLTLKSVRASMVCVKPLASATSPKSPGPSTLARTSVLMRPSSRVAMRQPTTQPAPLAVLARSESPSSDPLIPASAVARHI